MILQKKKHTCMLLYLLKVLKQRGHENWVGPMRIWAGVGIQYWPLCSVLVGAWVKIPLAATSNWSVIWSVDEEISVDEMRSAWWSEEIKLEGWWFGSPKFKATVTVSSWSPSQALKLSTSIALEEESWSSGAGAGSGLAGLEPSRGRASLIGGDGGDDEEEYWWWWWWW